MLVTVNTCVIGVCSTDFKSTEVSFTDHVEVIVALVLIVADSFKRSNVLNFVVYGENRDIIGEARESTCTVILVLAERLLSDTVTVNLDEVSTEVIPA